MGERCQSRVGKGEKGDGNWRAQTSNSYFEMDVGVEDFGRKVDNRRFERVVHGYIDDKLVKDVRVGRIRRTTNRSPPFKKPVVVNTAKPEVLRRFFRLHSLELMHQSSSGRHSVKQARQEASESKTKFRTPTPNQVKSPYSPPMEVRTLVVSSQWT